VSCPVSADSSSALSRAQGLPFQYRRAGLEEKLKQEQYSEEEKRRIIEESEQRERDYTRLQRQRLSIADFEALTIIGRGAFGEVHFLYFPEGGVVALSGSHAHF